MLELSSIKIFYLITFLMLLQIFNSSASMLASWKSIDGPLMTKWAAEVSANNALPEYPRPQLKREQWLNLNGLWDYAIIPREASAPQIYDGQILVPFPIESSLSGVAKNVGETNRLYYKRTFTIPISWESKNVILNFGAVDFEAEVYINNKNVGNHKGGYDAFSFDITDYLILDSENEIVVSVYDPIDSGTQPHGKQVKEPGGIMYTSVTGIWQTVWLEPVSANSIKDVRFIPNIDNNTIQIKVSTTDTNSKSIIEGSILDEGNEVVKFSTITNESKIVKIPNVKLWSPDSPFLYEVKIVLENENSGPSDVVESYFGMRKISLGKDEMGVTRMMFNNEFVFQNGFLDQGWWPDGLYTAPTDEALKYDIEMTKNMGFNLARKHVKVEPQRWYYWCDLLGLFVWQDMPSGDEGIQPTTVSDLERTDESANQYMTELKEMINELYSHPCIVVWVPFNEGWGQWQTEKVTKQIKEWDPSRLVNSASGWTDRGCGDINDMHSYPGPDMPPLENDRAVVLGEYGGLGFPIAGHTWKSQDNWGYVSYENAEELTHAYSNLTRKLLELKNDGLSAAVYTQTTDVEVEVNGLMTYDRKVTKIAPKKLRKINEGFLPPIFIAENELFLDSVEVKISNSTNSGEILYTIDGTEPMRNSKVYIHPLILKESTLVKAKTFWADGTFTTANRINYTKVELVDESMNVDNSQSGINYKYFENNSKRYSHLPDYETIEPIEEGITSQINIKKSIRDLDLGFTFEGYIKINNDGVYTFYISSNDGSMLKIGQSLVIDHDGAHGMNEKSTSMALKNGYYKISVKHFQGGGGKGLLVSYKGPGVNKTEIPAHILFH